MITGARANKYFQMAWVVDDLHTSIKHWQESAGVGPFFVIEKVPLTGLKYRGKAADHLSWGAAIAHAGDVQIELIQPYDGASSPYREFVKSGAAGFHHVAAIAEDLDAEIALYRGLGCDLIVEGMTGPVRFALVDTYARQGCITELVSEHPMVHQSAKFFADAAKDWDGAEPVRWLSLDFAANK